PDQHWPPLQNPAGGGDAPARAPVSQTVSQSTNQQTPSSIQPQKSSIQYPASATPQPPSPDLLGATVRLRVEDTKGGSVGTGTIIDSRSGDALVITSGHLFRDSQGKDAVPV